VVCSAACGRIALIIGGDGGEQQHLRYCSWVVREQYVELVANDATLNFKKNLICSVLLADGGCSSIGRQVESFRRKRFSFIVNERLRLSTHF